MPTLLATPRKSSISSVEYASRKRSSRMTSAPRSWSSLENPRATEPCIWSSVRSVSCRLSCSSVETVRRAAISRSIPSWVMAPVRRSLSKNAR